MMMEKNQPFGTESEAEFEGSELGLPDRAQLGVDGNCGFALLGRNIQEGEAEFVEFDTNVPEGSAEWNNRAREAALRAFNALRRRLHDRDFGFYYGPSYPGT
jgi:hypothetical protein